MATTKKSATTENKENKEMSSSQDVTKILEMMADMQNKFNAIMQENEALKEKISNIEKIESEIEEGMLQEETRNNVVQPSYVSAGEVQTPLSKIKIYHMQELVGGTVTYIKLKQTTRTLRHMGQVMTLSLNDFEELVGAYKHYFDKGVLALDASAMEYADLYDLPIYDAKTKATYNANVLKNVVNYNYDQLQEFYNSLSETNKTSFLNYWLGQVYEKTPGYYDMQKMRWLNTISGMEVFSSILVEMENENRRKQTNVVDGNKM